ncbi:MAG: lipopolysaccharide biosynthesis protein [Deltaproteobacteria bacterium]|nr:lipopolysaccharide biosynthesis protein [Deltaproteobacteria bacterium]
MTEADHGPQTLQDYMVFLRRRKWFIVVPWLVILCIASVVAYLLPAIYQSKATILIESQQVPEDLVRTTVTGYAEERIKTITEQILSRQTLEQIIKDFQLYPDLQGKEPVENILSKMREDILVEMVSAMVPSRRTERQVEVNVAFTVSYDGTDPEKVVQVTKRLTSLFLEYNKSIRENLAKTTTNILEQQLEDYRDTTRLLEEKIARFKEGHLTELPELMRLNLETERQVRRQIEGIEAKMLALGDRKVYLEGQLATISPNVLLTGGQVWEPRDRLKLLRSQAISLEAGLSLKHPDVIKIRREIEELKKTVSVYDERRNLKEMLNDKEVRLEDLRNHTTDKHPDMLRLKQEISDIKIALADSQADEAGSADPADSGPTNPAYINLQTQIKGTEIELKSLQTQRKELDVKWQQYVKRLEKMPQVEQDYQDLIRDYSAAQKKYAETSAKLMEARQAEGLEESQVGEKFTVVDPPHLPEKPVKPNRMAIVLIGFILGLGAGVGLGAVREFTDTSIRTAMDVKRITGVPVMAAIPDVQEEVKMQSKMKRGKGS